MDLSALIFVVLAVGWAGYLLPKALKHHDDVALNRPVEEFSDAVRVLGRGTKPAAPAAAASTDRAVAAPTAPARAHTVTRESARNAAKRRRRVLGGLLVVLVAVTTANRLGYLPLWSVAVPAGMIVAFLVTARLTVRAQQVRRAAPVQPAVDRVAAAEASPDRRVAAQAEVEPDLAGEDTMGMSRAELAAAIAEPVLDEGGLWDPLPVTLPTYVNKARARRTVRTIEITGAAVTSSGHDAADSALAREAEAAAAQAAGAEAEAPESKAAGA